MITFTITHCHHDSQTHTTNVIKHEIVLGKKNKGAIYKTGQEIKFPF